MRRSWWLVALLLAAAGLMAFTAMRGGGSGRDRGAVAELANALGDRRLFEPRLTGFGYSPCQTRTVPDRLLPLVVCADPLRTLKDPKVQEARRRLESIRGEDAHADGVGRLFFGDASQAVEILEGATALSPGDARSWNDLAAAYFVRAHQTDQPRDLFQALDAAAKAQEADPQLPEARFNLALILDRLHLRESALAAWEGYGRTEDASSDWAEEARLRVRFLQQPPQAQLWEANLPKLRAAALNGDQASLRTLVRVSPQAAREHALESLLGQWGRAVLARDWESADTHLRMAAAVGQALQAEGGDASVARAVAAIQEKLAVSRQSPQLTQIAGGHVALEEGMKRFRGLHSKAAEPSFEQAREALRRAGSPAELWALSGLARCWAYEGRQGEAVDAFERVAGHARPAGFPSLEGWAEWGLGWLRVRQGKISEGFTHFRRAEAAYQKVGESENLGAVRHFLGENLSLLGQAGEGWSYRYRALRDLYGLPHSFRRHTLLMEGAAMISEEGLPHAGLLLQAEGIQIAEASQDPIILAEAHRGRGQLLVRAGRADEAAEDLQAAWRSASLAPDSAPGRKLIADLRWAEGEALRQRQPEAALEKLTEAVASFTDLKAPFSQVEGLLARARTYISLGRHDEAAQDLGAALEILEAPGSSIRDEDLKLSYSESIQDLYDEAIGFQWRHRNDRAAALSLLERARAFPRPVPDAGRLSPPSDGVAVAYALLDDRLLLWIVTEDGISALERPVGLQEMEGRVSSLLSALSEGSPDFQRLSAELHEILVPREVAAISEDKILYFVPDKSLNRVPFAALWNPATRRFLVEDHPVAIATGLAGLRSGGLPLSGRPSALIVGDPAFDRKLFSDLPRLTAARQEAQEALSVFPASWLLTGRQATTAAVLSKIDRAEVLIFIGHAVANANLPSRSFLLLAPSADPPDSGILLASDLAGRRLDRLGLVVLSACSTVGPRTTRPAGLAGIAKPFLEAGARSVVGTLWRVDDRKAQEVLVPFYRGLGTSPSPALALRNAQLEAIRQSRQAGSAVVDWAAFAVLSN